MGKIIQIEFPDWMDEQKIRTIINELIRGTLTDKDIETIEALLESLPKSKTNKKIVDELYYEGKMLY